MLLLISQTLRYLRGREFQAKKERKVKLRDISGCTYCVEPTHKKKKTKKVGAAGTFCGPQVWGRKLFVRTLLIGAAN